MKTINKFWTIIALCLLAVNLEAQTSCYWVFLTDKNGSTFDASSYFDAKAIERYEKEGVDLYDITNYPLSDAYRKDIAELSEETVGETRWFNAIAVMANEEQIEKISCLPFVKNIQLIASEMEIASCSIDGESESANQGNEDNPKSQSMYDQLLRMDGESFVKHDVHGKGIRIAIFDGGFPHVNTHSAFRHLIEGNRILKTWNFPKNSENVYGWNSHGTMVLSCVAGINKDGKMIGLATESEFLLARTELNTEPYKEEVYWLMAVEWADKNGAQVINSSLGYGKERHYPSEMDGKTTLVAKAANLAARKGMIICNSAGNEGDDKKWKTIATPADADSILTVGGITASLTEYSHISFSSYGPTADGRMKPNVCAFGYATTAQHNNNDNTTTAYGTSFSSPLVAGFVACAWQTQPNLKAMEMMREIEKSADLYPYFDYAFGFGVPQAGYFFNGKKNIEPTFELIEDESSITIVPSIDEQTFFINIQNGSGILDNYCESQSKNKDTITIAKSDVAGKTLNICSNGYFRSTKVEGSPNPSVIDFTPQGCDNSLSRNLNSNKTKNYGENNKHGMRPYYDLGFPIVTNSDEVSNGKSRSHTVGLMHYFNLTKTYRLGTSIEIGKTNFKSTEEALLENESTYKICHLNIELFQRVRLIPGGGFGGSLYWDLGVYGGMLFGGQKTYREWKEEGNSYFENIKIEKNLSNINKWQYGLRTRLTMGMIGVYGQYRLSDIMKEGNGNLKFPRFEMGLQINLPTD